MAKYDWDFRNFRIHDASLPYTTLERVQRAPAFGVSQIGNQRGLRATQNSYMSQEEQIFTMLESLSPSLADNSSQNELMSQNERQP